MITKRGFCLSLLLTVFMAAAAAAQPYVITRSEALFTATRGGETNIVASGSNIQAVIDAIRADADGAACTIFFGNTVVETVVDTFLNIGTASITFNDTAGANWGDTITLLGSVTSSGTVISVQNNITMLVGGSITAAGTATGIVVGNFSTTATGSLTVIEGARISSNENAVGFYSLGTLRISGGIIETRGSDGSPFSAVDFYGRGPEGAAGALVIEGGTIQTTAGSTGRALTVGFASGSAARVTINGGTVQALGSGSAVYLQGGGTITILGSATITSVNTSDTTGTIHNNNNGGGNVEIRGGTVTNTAGGNAVFCRPNGNVGSLLLRDSPVVNGRISGFRPEGISVAAGTSIEGSLVLNPNRNHRTAGSVMVTGDGAAASAGNFSLHGRTFVLNNVGGDLVLAANPDPALVTPRYNIEAVNASTFMTINRDGDSTIEGSIQSVIDFIRFDAGGDPCTISFVGTGGQSLDIGASGITFSNTSVNDSIGTWWGDLITLWGSVTSSFAGNVIIVYSDISMLVGGSITAANGSAGINFFSDNWGHRSTGSLTVIEGARISSNGSAVSFSSTGRLTISGGIIQTSGSNNNSSAVNFNGRGTTSALEISGGTIETTAGSTGSALTVSFEFTSPYGVTITGGTVQALGGGSAVHLVNGTITISDSAAITSRNTSGSSATIHNENNGGGNVRIHGGTVTNTAGGNAVFCRPNFAGSLSLGGSPVVNGRIISELPSDSIRVAQDFDPGSNLYVLQFPNAVLPFTAVTGGAAHLSNFTLSSADTVLQPSGGNLILAAGDNIIIRTVTFNANGGTGGIIMPGVIYVDANNPMVYFPPSAAGFTRAGHTPSGKWCNDPACTEEFDFGADIVFEDMTLYMGWDENPAVTVRFSANGGTHATVVIDTVARRTEAGGTIPVGQIPPYAAGFTREGHTRVGNNGTTAWYTRTGTAPNFTYTQFVFGPAGTGTPVSEDITLYLQWTANIYVVTFADGIGNIIDTKHVAHGGGAAAPPDPIRDGFTFDGWDIAFDNVTDTLTVTAQWTAVGASQVLAGIRFLTPAPNASIVFGSSAYLVTVEAFDTSGAAYTGGVVEIELTAALSDTLRESKDIETDGSTGAAAFRHVQASGVDGSIIMFIARVTVGGTAIADTAFLRITPPAASKQAHSLQVPEPLVLSRTAAVTGEFTAGPNPAALSSGSVKIFRTGNHVEPAVLTIYNASGSIVNRINIDDRTGAVSDTRHAGTWNLRDTRGRQVSAGTYLLRGTVTTSEGKRERVSVIIGVQ